MAHFRQAKPYVFFDVRIQCTMPALRRSGGAASEIVHKAHKSAPATFQGPRLTSKSATDAVLEIGDGKVSR